LKEKSKISAPDADLWMAANLSITVLRCGGPVRSGDGPPSGKHTPKRYNPRDRHRRRNVVTWSAP
jgi:hypothetical protein